MAYLEIRHNGKLVKQQEVDSEKAKRGFKVNIGSLGQVFVKLGQTVTLGDYEIQIPDDTSQAEQQSEKQDFIPTLSEDDMPQLRETFALGSKDSFPKIEGYRIIEKIGKGGMGTVWKAEQLSTKRLVALKLMVSHSADSRKAQARFQREVELTSRLDHPNIAMIYDSGLHHGNYYYAMEYIDGLPLDRYIKEQRLSRKHILELMQKVCFAVLYAHLRAVIHRDLKPSNIIVDYDGEPHILDFGLAKALLDDETLAVSMEGQIAGTPAYMSPEQASGQHHDLDTRTDVFSLGVILYELLTDKSPHDLSGSMLDILHNIKEGNITRPSQINSRIDVELEAIILKALSLDPEERYASAGMMGTDIKNYLDGEPLNAIVPTTIYFLRKKAVKYKKQVIISAIALLVIFVTIISIYTKIVAQQSALRATKEEKEVLKTEVGNLRARILSGNQEEIEAALNSLEQRYVTSETKIQEYEHLLERAIGPTSSTLSEIGFYFDKPVNISEPLNSPDLDTTPSISSDGLEMYFSSNRADSTGNINDDIWVVRRDSKQDSWGKPVNLGVRINSSSSERSPQLSPDGLILLFASDREGGYGDYDIYEIRRFTTESSWSEPENLGPVVNSSNIDTDPSISADNRVLYFATKRKGRLGDIDIWRTTRETTKDQWNTPIAMAPEINSSFQDEKPCISSDDLVLLFCSNRPGGYGGYDIYLSRRATTFQPWSKPVNIGPVVNSKTDDDFAVIDKSDSVILFSSERSGGCGGVDIWQVPISTTNTGFTCEPAKGELMAYYPFDSDTIDASGYGWHGIGQGEPLNYEEGKIGKALSLPGKSSSISEQHILTEATASILGIGGANPRTICAWVYTRVYNNGAIFDIGNNSELQEFSLRVFERTNLWRAQTWDIDLDFTYPSINEWVHFAMVYDGSQVIVYANGELIASEARNLDTTDGISFQIGLFKGRSNSNYAPYFNGIIDDVQVYNYALTQAEIKVAMAGVARGTPMARVSPDGEITGRGLVAYYPLDGNVRDYTGNGFNGEVQNGPVTYVAGKVGRAVSLNNSTDKFVATEAIATDLGINGNNPKTVCAWVYTREFNNSSIFEIGNPSIRQQFCLRTNNTTNSWRAQMHPAGFNFDYLSENVWVHFAMTYDGTQLIVYANGESVVNQTFNINTVGNRTFQIGKFSQQNIYFNGLIDDVRVYNYALTKSEIEVVMTGKHL